MFLIETFRIFPILKYVSLNWITRFLVFIGLSITGGGEYHLNCETQPRCVRASANISWPVEQSSVSCDPNRQSACQKLCYQSISVFKSQDVIYPLKAHNSTRTIPVILLIMNKINYLMQSIQLYVTFLSHACGNGVRIAIQGE